MRALPTCCASPRRRSTRASPTCSAWPSCSARSCGVAEPLTVIGAGPVGSLLALFLARRGHEVRVFERRPDMRRVRIGAGRSINLAVSTRGLYALHQVGLDGEVLRQAIPMYGRMVHAAGSDPRFLRYGRDDTEFINSMSRGELNELLMTEAERTGRVRIEFQQRLVGYAGGRARLRDERSGEEREVLAPVIFGSDGSASALRGSLPIEVEQSWLDFGYKELTLPPSPGGGFSLEKNALHIWPRKNFMLIALPNLDGSFTCTLFLPFEGPASFAAIEEPAAAERFFAETFPDALALVARAGGADRRRRARDRPLLRAGDERGLRGLHRADGDPRSRSGLVRRLRRAVPGAEARRGRDRRPGGGELRRDARQGGRPRLPPLEGGRGRTVPPLPRRIPLPLPTGHFHPHPVPHRPGGRPPPDLPPPRTDPHRPLRLLRRLFPGPLPHPLPPPPFARAIRAGLERGLIRFTQRARRRGRRGGASWFQEKRKLLRDLPFLPSSA